MKQIGHALASMGWCVVLMLVAVAVVVAVILLVGSVVDRLCVVCVCVILLWYFVCVLVVNVSVVAACSFYC